MLKKRKQPEKEVRSGEEEKYRFMREQIRPQRQRILKGFLLKALGIVVLAMIFGAIAGSTFIFMQNIMETGNETQAREAMLQDTPDVEATREPEENDGRGKVLTGEPLEYYQAFWEEVASVGRRCRRSLVKIRRKQSESGFHKSEELGDVQSGVIFQESRSYYYILAPSRHLQKTKPVEVEFSGGETVAAKFSGVDDTLEIAVLTVEKKIVSKEIKTELQIAEFDEAVRIGIGFPVIAVGCPNGVMGSVVSGRIVNDGLTTEVTDGEVDLYSSDIKYCEEGNGFVVDMEGKIVGIITNSHENVTGKAGCAFMEISKIRSVISHLAKGKEMVYFGMTGCDYDDRKNSGVADGGGGIYVNSVISRSPAYQGGLRVADVITAVDGNRVRNLQDLRECLLTYEEGSKIEVTIHRHSGNARSERKLKVVLGSGSNAR